MALWVKLRSASVGAAQDEVISLGGPARISRGRVGPVVEDWESRSGSSDQSLTDLQGQVHQQQPQGGDRQVQHNQEVSTKYYYIVFVCLPQFT